MSVKFSAACAVMLAWSALVPAQAEERKPLTLRVSPRLVETDPGEEARARQARLLKRMEEAAYRFHNICRNCGPGIEGPGAYDPFDPVSRLSGAPAPADPPRVPAPMPEPEPAVPAAQP